MRKAAGLLAAAALMALAGCSAPGTGPGEGASATSPDVSAMDRSYTDRDKDPSYDPTSATRIQLDGETAVIDGPGASAEGGVVTISAEGTYLVSGQATQGQLVVDLPGDEDKAQVVLDGASITNATGPALYVRNADKAFLTLAEGSSNALADGEAYQLEEGSDEPYATLFSKDDLTINGSGALTVTASYRHGICSKDDLVVTGGSITVTAPEDALRGRDCVKVLDGTFDLDAGEDAVKSNNDEDGARGFVSLDGGVFKLVAGDDAVHAETALFAEAGEVTVEQSYEGYEACQIYLNGGSHAITSSDDALNASDGSSSDDPMAVSEQCLIRMSGGIVVLDAQGDAVDSNGSVEMIGGELYATGPDSGADGALDYASEAMVTGGTVVLTGSAGMAEDFSGGTQAFALIMAEGAAGSLVEVADGEGQVLASFTPKRAFQAVNVTAPELVDGEAYSLVIDGTATEFTASTTPSRTAGPGGMGGHGPHDGSGAPEMPDGQGMGEGQGPREGNRPEGQPSPGGAPDGQQPPSGDGAASGGEPPEPPARGEGARPAQQAA